MLDNETQQRQNQRAMSLQKRLLLDLTNALTAPTHLYKMSNVETRNNIPIPSPSTQSPPPKAPHFAAPQKPTAITHPSIHPSVHPFITMCFYTREVYYCSCTFAPAKLTGLCDRKRQGLPCLPDFTYHRTIACCDKHWWMDTFRESAPDGAEEGGRNGGPRHG